MKKLQSGNICARNPQPVCAVEAPRPLEIPSELDYIDNSLGSLTDAIAVLHSRLLAVSAPMPPETATPQSASLGSDLSPVGQRLAGIKTTIHGLTNHIKTITENLAI